MSCSKGWCGNELTNCSDVELPRKELGQHRYSHREELSDAEAEKADKDRISDDIGHEPEQELHAQCTRYREQDRSSFAKPVDDTR